MDPAMITALVDRLKSSSMWLNMREPAEYFGKVRLPQPSAGRTTAEILSKRVTTNVAYFRYNYGAILALFLLYKTVTSLLFFFVVAIIATLCVGAFVVHGRNLPPAKRKRKEKIIAVAATSILIIVVSGLLGVICIMTVLWLIVVLAHAALDNV